MIRLLIVDDHTVVRKGLQQIVATTSDIRIAAEATSGNAALQLLSNKETELDVVLLDISMPQGLSGLETLQQIKREKAEQPVLILSVLQEEQYAVRAFKLGASGYLSKNSSADEILTAIRKVAGGGRYVSKGLAETMVDYISGESDRPRYHLLSNRELQVMIMLASGNSSTDIAKTLSLSVKTISTHRARLLQKLNLKNNADIIRYAIKHNLAQHP